MKRVTYSIAIALSLLTVGFSNAQDQNKDQADSKFKSYAFIDAAKIYENLIKKGYDSEDLHRKLADAYYFNSKYSEAAKHYVAYVEKSQNAEPMVYFRLAKSLDASGASEQSKKYYQLFNDSQPESSQAATFINLFDEFFNHEGVVVPAKELNSLASEYPVFYHEGSLLVVTNNHDSKQIDPWSNKPFTQLRKIEVASNSSNSVLPSYIPYHEGSAGVDAKGTTLYVTLNALSKSNNKKEEVEATLKIYRFVQKRGKWVYDSSLPFNSENYNTAHPALSKDGSTLYFASDRPGGFGASDIYKVAVNSDGSFGTPENLGASVNTVGRESFPQLDILGQLIFASDGHKGFGGYDLFGIDLEAEKPIAVNLGEPINSHQDDFEMVYFDGKKGYFASNRNAASGDDIYEFQLDQPMDFTPSNAIKGRVVANGAPLSGVNLKLQDDSKKSQDSHSWADGNFHYQIDGKRNASVLQLEKEGYQPKEVVVPATVDFKSIDLGDIEMVKSISGLAKNDDLAKFFNIDMIYFNFDKWDILPKSEEDLAKIAEVLQQYPSMKIEIRSHTDQLGSNAYNQVLSEKRAKSTYEYLVKLGVNPSQMSANGFGESLPAVKCEGCSIKERMVNRRSEFIVVENQ